MGLVRIKNGKHFCVQIKGQNRLHEIPVAIVENSLFLEMFFLKSVRLRGT